MTLCPNVSPRTAAGLLGRFRLPGRLRGHCGVARGRGTLHHGLDGAPVPSRSHGRRRADMDRPGRREPPGPAVSDSAVLDDARRRRWCSTCAGSEADQKRTS